MTTWVTGSQNWPCEQRECKWELGRGVGMWAEKVLILLLKDLSYPFTSPQSHCHSFSKIGVNQPSYPQLLHWYFSFPLKFIYTPINKMYVDTCYVFTFICTLIFTYTHIHSVVFLPNPFNTSYLLQDNILAPWHKWLVLVSSAFLSATPFPFLSLNSTLQHWSIMKSHYTLAFLVTAFNDRDKTAQIPALLPPLNPKARAKVQEKVCGEWWIRDPAQLPFFHLRLGLSTSKSRIIACLLCAVYGKGSKVNSLGYLIHFADTQAGTLSIIMS
jgi:hypothetical protein